VGGGNFSSKRNELIFFSKKEVSLDAELSSQKPKKITEALSGVAVALAVFPASIAYSNIAGLNPILGIWTSFFVGLISALYGGRPGLIAAASSAVSVPIGPIIKNLGPGYLQASVSVSSLIVALCSFFKVGRFISLVSDPPLFGFLNGMGFVIGKSQLKVFANLKGTALYTAILVALFTSSFILLIPLLLPNLPSSLVALILATLVCTAFKLPVKTLSDIGGSSMYSGGFSSLPKFSSFLPQVPLTFSTVQAVGPTALSIAVVIYLQSLLASKTVVEAPKTSFVAETDNDRVLMGMSIGNFISGIFGGMGGCGTLFYTKLNILNGGRGVLSAVVANLALGFFILLAAPVVGKIPLASLAGVIFVLSYHSVKWGASWKIAKLGVSKQGTAANKIDFIALIVSSYLCAFSDMALGIVTGAIITNLGRSMFSKESG